MAKVMPSEAHVWTLTANRATDLIAVIGSASIISILDVHREGALQSRWPYPQNCEKLMQSP